MRERDTITALDMFSGCGGSSQGIEAAGIDVWYAANHWDYAVRIHEANHPDAQHFIADLVDETAKDYRHPEQLPGADFLWASPSCTNHSQANATKAYERNLSLFEVFDPDYEAQVTHSERSRATAVCVLQYARKHRPRVIAVENVVQFAQWGPGRDGSTYRWWLDELHKLGYDTRSLFLNSQFFDVPQSRDRMYVAAWQRDGRRPDLDHRPEAVCSKCGPVEAVQAFKPRQRSWPLPQWGVFGQQYRYACPACRVEVAPAMPGAERIIDWSDLGEPVLGRDKPLADSTLERIRRGLSKMSPVSAELAAMAVVAAGNTFERSGSSCRTREISAPLWTQHGTQSFGVAAATVPLQFEHGMTGTDEPLRTQTGRQSMALTTACVVPFRNNTLATGMHRPTPTQSTECVPALLAAQVKQNGGPGDTAWHSMAAPVGTLTTRDVTGVIAGWQPTMEDCRFRMLKPDEIKRGMGIADDFTMFGSARDRVRALGNAVTPSVATWLCDRLASTMR